MTDDRLSGPKPDALPGCATPRHPEAPSFSAVSGQAESSARGNEWQNGAGTGEQTPGIVPDLGFEKALTANPDFSGVSDANTGKTEAFSANSVESAGKAPAAQTPDAPECPECGGDLLRGEDPHGVTWQCFAPDCLSHFADDEITKAGPQ